MGKFKVWQDSLFATFSGSVDPAGTAGATDVTGRLSSVETRLASATGSLVVASGIAVSASASATAISGRLVDLGVSGVSGVF